MSQIENAQPTSNLLKIVLIAIAFLVVLSIGAGLIAAGSYVKWRDYASDTEIALSTTMDNNVAIRAEYFNKVQELAQVPTMYVADLGKLYKDTIEGRYGNDGSKAVLQFIVEKNPDLDPEMYKHIMRVIEAGRNEFANNQTRLLDMKGIYKMNINRLWSGTWIKIAGYPKMDLNAIKPISTEKANSEAETHISTPLKLTM